MGMELSLLPLMENHRLKELEEGVLRRIVTPKREDVTGCKALKCIMTSFVPNQRRSNGLSMLSAQDMRNEHNILVRKANGST